MGLFPSAEWGKSKKDYKFGLVYCFRKRMALTLNFSSGENGELPCPDLGFGVWNWNTKSKFPAD